MPKSTSMKTTKKKVKSPKKSDKMTAKTFETAKKRRELFLRAKIKAAERFSVVARQKLGNLCKAVAVIGSLARNDFKPGSDIDVLVVLDDTQRDVPDELKEKLLAMLNEIGRKIDKKMQVQIHTITEMFQFAKEGDNIIYNFLRHSKVVYDGGILKPLKNLLKAGEIKPSKESVMRSMEGADFYMKKVNQYVEWILERYYRAITWAGNAYFMAMGEKPASVPEIPILLKEHADKGEISQEIPVIAAEVIKKFKAVEHEEEKPDLKTIYELLPKVNAYLDAMRKDVLGSVMGDTIKGTMKAKIKTMPKIIFEFEKGRAFVWLLDDGVYLANYNNEKLTKVYKSKIDKGKVDTFKATKNEKLFGAMETSDLKPLINIDLIKMIHSALPEAVKRSVKKVAIEYPGRAMIDLGNILK